MNDRGFIIRILDSHSQVKHNHCCFFLLSDKSTYAVIRKLFEYTANCNVAQAVAVSVVVYSKLQLNHHRDVSLALFNESNTKLSNTQSTFWLFILFSFRSGTCNRNYVIKDANNTHMLTIIGPCCICNGNYSCGCRNNFIVSSIVVKKTILKLYMNFALFF